MLNFIMFFTKLLQILYIIMRVCQEFLLEFALETRLDSNTGRPLRHGVYLFPTDWNLCLSTRKPEPSRSYQEKSLLYFPMGFLSHNFIRLGQTRAKALQTVIRFPRETRRGSAIPKSNGFPLLDLCGIPWGFPGWSFFRSQVLWTVKKILTRQTRFQ